MAEDALKNEAIEWLPDASDLVARVFQHYDEAIAKTGGMNTDEEIAGFVDAWLHLQRSRGRATYWRWKREHATKGVSSE